MKPARRPLTPAAIALTGAALLAACSSPQQDSAIQAAQQEQLVSLFAQVDEDGDGKVTPEEFQDKYVAITWRFMDKNGDGVITAAEWALEGRSAKRDQWFATLDSDHDGRITRAEFEAARSPEGAARYFALMDRSGDGTITPEDLRR